MEPKKMVVKSCAMEPKTVIKTPWILSAFSRQNTLPPYSPILFGVKTETVIPEKTARKDMNQVGLV